MKWIMVISTRISDFNKKIVYILCKNTIVFRGRIVIYYFHKLQSISKKKEEEK